MDLRTTSVLLWGTFLAVLSSANCDCVCENHTLVIEKQAFGNCLRPDGSGKLFCFVSREAAKACLDAKQVDPKIYGFHQKRKYLSYLACRGANAKIVPEDFTEKSPNNERQVISEAAKIIQDIATKSASNTETRGQQRFPTPRVGLDGILDDIISVSSNQNEPPSGAQDEKELSSVGVARVYENLKTKLESRPVNEAIEVLWKIASKYEDQQRLQISRGNSGSSEAIKVLLKLSDEFDRKTQKQTVFQVGAAAISDQVAKTALESHLKSAEPIKIGVAGIVDRIDAVVVDPPYPEHVGVSRLVQRIAESLRDGTLSADENESAEFSAVGVGGIFGAIRKQVQEQESQDSQK